VPAGAGDRGIDIMGATTVGPGIPATPEEISAEWLTAALAAGGAGDGAVVTALGMEPVGVGVGLMGLLFRLTPTYGVGSGPATMVLKMAPPYPQVREIASGYGFYGREVSMYRELGPELGLRPPQLYYGDHDASSDDFVLVMEDLGHLRSSDQLTGCSVADAQLIVTQLARHHARWWEDPRLETLSYVQSFADPPFPQYHDQACKQSWPIAVERFGHLMPPRIIALGERWSEIGPALMEDGPNHARTLCHGDVRLDNVFFHDDGDDSVSIVDWQIAGHGPAANDLGYFMSQSLTVEDRREHGEALGLLYYDTLVDGGVRNYRFAEFWDDYRRAALFCLCYPLQGGAVELANDRALALATSMLERSMAAIIDLDADALAP